MGQEKLAAIDIPAARTLILKSIAEHRRLHAVSLLVEGFFNTLDPKKKLNKLAGAKLFNTLAEDETILVKRVDFDVTYNYVGVPSYQFTVNLYNIEHSSMWFSLRTREEKRDDYLVLWDMDYAMKDGNRLHAQRAGVLEEKLKTFATEARRFNTHLEALKKSVDFAGDERLGIWPLSSIFYWYELHN